MAVSRAGNYQDYSSSSSSKLIQQLYSKKLRKYYYEYDVIPYITNKDAENQSSIKQMGDKVIFRSLPDITTYNYSKGQSITPQYVVADALELEIDKAKGFFIGLDNIDKFQMDINYLDECAQHGARILSTDICTAFLADIPDSANASNAGTSAGYKSANINLGTSGSPRVLTKDNIIYWFNDMQQVLSEYDIPDDGKRHVTISPAIYNMIMSSDLKNASFMGNGKSFLATGEHVGELAGFKIHVTNSVETATDGSYKTFNVIFNHMDAIAFCMQITESKLIETLETTHGSAFRALSVYGYKSVQDKGLGLSYVAVQN